MRFSMYRRENFGTMEDKMLYFPKSQDDHPDSMPSQKNRETQKLKTRIEQYGIWIMHFSTV